ncbi:F-box/kelch-repeat protein-like [Quillaja saponaria]|uniref:F-box/kelch-repeat protein-like n=1 Tax=Quillaja saponaria TaxID=32244 RepID=A0AAD7M5R8_QUISA|nr:F-box/kelch-repeat protein-like [Quillaja saponaria]
MGSVISENRSLKICTCSCKRKQKGSAYILLNEIIFEILLRVPAEILHHCLRYICRQWHGTISDPFFIHSHLRQSTTGLLMHLRHAPSNPWPLPLIESFRSTYPFPLFGVERTADDESTMLCYSPSQNCWISSPLDMIEFCGLFFSCIGLSDISKVNVAESWFVISYVVIGVKWMELVPLLKAVSTAVTGVKLRSYLSW